MTIIIPVTTAVIIILLLGRCHDSRAGKQTQASSLSGTHHLYVSPEVGREGAWKLLAGAIGYPGETARAPACLAPVSVPLSGGCRAIGAVLGDTANLHTCTGWV